VMGKYVNSNVLIALLVTIGLIVVYLNMMLLRSLF
jgi:hypothetical protein